YKTDSLMQSPCFDVAAFNLDTEKVLQKTGDPGSLFGFSVSFHQQLSPARKNLLLVGAPRAKHENQVNVTGVVYQCDLSEASQHCQPIEFQSKGTFDFICFCLLPNATQSRLQFHMSKHAETR
uniref:Uncharacterized protein n=1 Tax=Salarias fasciatus TaxID=181472 RepID=A0A672GCH9_SALFA